MRIKRKDEIDREKLAACIGCFFFGWAMTTVGWVTPGWALVIMSIWIGWDEVRG